MTAALLREAAALMRERAEAEPATGWVKCDFNDGDHRPLWGVANDAFFNPPADEDVPWLAIEVHTGTEATAEHIASWHPAVALAVADWLDDEANTGEQLRDVLREVEGRDDLNWEYGGLGKAMAVARAYLGREA